MRQIPALAALRLGLLLLVATHGCAQKAVLVKGEVLLPAKWKDEVLLLEVARSGSNQAPEHSTDAVRAGGKARFSISLEPGKYRFMLSALRSNARWEKTAEVTGPVVFSWSVPKSLHYSVKVVDDATGQPISGASVGLTADLLLKLTEKRTDASGETSFVVGPAGGMTSVEADGFLGRSIFVPFRDDGKLHHVVRLRRSPCLTVRVRADGRPHPGQLLVAIARSDGTKTDRASVFRGRAEFAYLEPGMYVVSVRDEFASQKGDASASVEVVPRKSQTVSLELSLTPAEHARHLHEAALRIPSDFHIDEYARVEKPVVSEIDHGHRVSIKVRFPSRAGFHLKDIFGLLERLEHVLVGAHVSSLDFGSKDPTGPFWRVKEVTVSKHLRPDRTSQATSFSIVSGLMEFHSAFERVAAKHGGRLRNWRMVGFTATIGVSAGPACIKALRSEVDPLRGLDLKVDREESGKHLLTLRVTADPPVNRGA